MKILSFPPPLIGLIWALLAYLCYAQDDTLRYPPIVTRSIASPCAQRRQSAGSKLDLLPQECGKAPPESLRFNEVYEVFAFPWMAVVRYEENGTIIDGCAGSLINERYILTAAHCIKTRSNRKLHSVILGEHTKGQDIDCNVFISEKHCADAPEEFGIESFEVHDDYNDPEFSNDIGLIRLNRDVTMQDHIKPVCLPMSDDFKKESPNFSILTGWGTIENGTPSNVLQQAFLYRVDSGECQRKLNVTLDSRQMCVVSENSEDLCRGDAGGPLGAYNHIRGARFVQHGIVSTAGGYCGQDDAPGVCTLVADYVDWILDRIRPSC